MKRKNIAFDALWVLILALQGANNMSTGRQSFAFADILLAGLMLGLIVQEVSDRLSGKYRK